jgi:hypothetical protein
MVKGIALWLVRGLKGGGAEAGIGRGLELVSSPTQRPLRIPPSAEKTRLTSKPGVLVGTPLKSRHDIWSRVTVGCDEALGPEPMGWSRVISPPDDDGSTCGSCLGEMGSECRGGMVEAGGNDSGKEKLSRAGADVPRFSSSASEPAIFIPSPQALRQRSAIWAAGTGGGVVGFGVGGGGAIRMGFSGFCSVNRLFLTGLDEMNSISSSAAGLLAGVTGRGPSDSVLPGGAGSWGCSGCSSFGGEDMFTRDEGARSKIPKGFGETGEKLSAWRRDRKNGRIYAWAVKARPPPSLVWANRVSS